VPPTDEHVRYAGFIARLAAASQPNEAFVVEFMKDVTSDPDPAMGQSAAIALIDHPGLPNSLLDRIKETMPSEWGAAATRLAERQLQLKIEDAPSDTAAWSDAVASGSRRLQLWLLDQPNVPTSTLQSLATEGGTRAIRNRASEAVRRASKP
jgi:hypothetical protein